MTAAPTAMHLQQTQTLLQVSPPALRLRLYHHDLHLIKGGMETGLMLRAESGLPLVSHKLVRHVSYLKVSSARSPEDAAGSTKRSRFNRNVQG
jgi:hypothetical protein